MILNPADLVAVAFAIILDSFGFLCLFLNYIFGTVLGENLSSVSDSIGAFIFGAWIIATSGGIRAAFNVRKSKGKVVKYILTFVGESLPFVGALPFWTIYIFSVIKKRWAGKGTDKAEGKEQESQSKQGKMSKEEYRRVFKGGIVKPK